MNFKITKILLILSIFLFNACGDSFSSAARTEMKEMCTLLAQKKYQEFSSRLLTKSEFEEDIYPYLPEAKQKGPVPVNDYWMFSTIENQKAMNIFFKTFGQEEELKFKKFGEPAKIKKFDNGIIVYNHIPVYFTENTGKEIKIDNFIEALVSTKDKCRVWSLGTGD
ncbi:MAG: hypothetical protein JW864_08825 [Spirochaetes bacterium]|nr:hypothetical protein [Spirochaetota bacterium]